MDGGNGGNAGAIASQNGIQVETASKLIDVERKRT
jgi:hypothetical protein